MDEDRENAANAGFTAHMAKPVDVEELFTLIQKLTSKIC
jgi:CheY-like chemotaxis protein